MISKRMTIIIVTLLLISLVSIPKISADTRIGENEKAPFRIIEHNIYIILNETNFAIVLENIKLNFTTQTNEFNLKILAEEVMHVNVYEGNNQYQYNLIDREEYWDLRIELNGATTVGEIRNFTIIYITNSYCEKTEGNYVIFDYPYISQAYTDYLKIKVRLPKSGSISDEKFSIFPKPNKNWTDGTYFFFEWRYYSVDEGFSIILHMKYLLEEKGTQVAPPSQTGINPYIAFIVGIPLGIGTSLLVYFLTEQLKAMKSKRKEEGIINLGVFLSDNEKKVLQSIIKHKGKCWQSEIVLDTHLSKAAVSLSLVSLEKKGLITRERMGRENLVKTTEKLEKIKDLLKG